MRQQLSPLFLLVTALMILALMPFFLKDLYEIVFAERRPEFLTDFEVFMKDWCRVRHFRTDLASVVRPCQNQLKWTPRRSGVLTNASQSFVSSWDLKPAGQFSRFFIQAVSGDGQVKTTGGDWWRILINGIASLRPTVFDLGNGTYEVLFLVVEPGIYSVEITLDYTLCDGFRDPPDNWFIIGKVLKLLRF